MKENTRIELTQEQYEALSAMSIGGPSSNHNMTVGIKTPVTSGNHAPDNIDTAPIQSDSLAGGTEWNGEGLPPSGCECLAVFIDHENKGYGEFTVCGYHNEYVWLEYIGNLKNKGKHYTADVSKVKFRKLETEAERNERERLEAAIWLLDGNGNSELCCWSDARQELKDHLLWIVDETGYRKE